MADGLPESIVAAACARLGLTVLHLDRNDYYGGPWSSFNLEGWEKWVNEFSLEKEELEEEHFQEIASVSDLAENERLLFCRAPRNQYMDVCSQWLTVSEGNEAQEMVKESENDDDDDDDENGEVKESGSNEATAEPETNTELGSYQEQTNNSSSLWTEAQVTKEWRRFSLDVTPKVLCGRGKMVQLLISSGVSRYAEFKCVDRILTRISGEYRQVPCSRSDVFQTKDVSMIEKRRLMKFLMFCLNFQEEEMEWKEYENKCFDEFLNSRDLSPVIQHYIRCAIAMVPEKTATRKGLMSVHKFLMSVGRFGNSPFLWTLYGSGELPQCFCRLCAVFGGVYCLRRPVDAWILNSENRCVAVVTGGQRISCQFLICDPTYLPDDFQTQMNCVEKEIVDRVVLITTDSILPDVKQHVSLMNIDSENTSVRLLEIGSGAMACPDKLNVVHLSAKRDEKNAISERVLKECFDLANDGSTSTAGVKPKVLWMSSFSYERKHTDCTSLPSNVGVTTWPDHEYDYEVSVEEARILFNKFWPDDDFLPEIPEQDELGFPESDPGINGFIPDPKEPSQSNPIRDDWGESEQPEQEKPDNIGEEVVYTEKKVDAHTVL